MGAIGLNPIRLDRIGLDPIRINAIKLGVPGASSGSDRPYIDPEVLASLKAVCICYGKSNDDPDRAVVKNLVDPDNPFVISNAAYTEGSGYADKGSPYYGAFVTDGVEDLITSTKTVQEMLGGSNEITVVSLITHISGTGKYNIIGDGGIQVSDYSGQTFMAGTSSSGEKIVELGDKEKLQAVQYTTFDSKLTIGLEDSSYAYYGTFVFNKENVPVDWIHQVIAYFNLDRTLNPDILCNTIKQGITNENHAEFGDKLIDFSGNGRDIQLNNIAWKGDSGIGKYETELSNTSIWTQSKETTCSPFSSSYNGLSGWIVFANTELTNSADMPSFKIQVKGLLEGQELIYRYYDSNGQSNVYSMGKDGEYTLPSDVRTAKPQTSNTSGFQVVKNETNIITITQIPSHVGALYLDGVSDFGKVTGMPIYKDYTFIIDRQIISIGDTAGVVASKSEDSTDVNKQGAFLFEYLGAPNNISAWSFYKDNGKVANTDFTRGISYQSTYSYNGKDLTIGTSKDSDKLWLGTIRDNDSRFFNGAIYSLMSFPYSMSEFLIERQLKKYKLGSLYPNMVEFRPVIKANANYNIFYTALLPLTGIVWEKINIGDYIPVGRRVAIQLSFDNEASELVSAISSQLGNISITKNSNNKGYTIFGDILKNKSPQKINITIDEYIRYEDIVQPYPVLLRFNDENGNEVSWGGKFRVGSTITRIGSVADSNLLPNIYNIFGLLLNDNQVTSSKVIVEKTMVFKAKSAYIFDNNEPKVILSPSRLRIPNSSYKILGYIPDISGHGNHGVIHNSAYKLNSGANGYLVDFTTFQDDGIKGIVRTDSKIYLDKSFNYNQGFWLGRTNSPSPAYKVKISGIPETGMLTYTGGIWLNLVNGINELPARTNTEEEHGFVAQSPNLDWSNLVIEQIGEYEGAYCLDGVDDFVTIPTLSSGGKQVLMKVNWNTLNSVLYDQRNGIEVPFCIGTGSGTIAYNHRNVGGNTFIDGILNNHILTDDLQAITHNIVLNNDYNVTNSNLFIGTNYIKSIYTKMALYDFMLFDNISTDDKIKELNEYVGIEGNVWGILTQLSNSTLISNETLIKNE